MNNSDGFLLTFLQNLATEIKLSFMKNCDKTNAMKTLNDFILNILEKDISLEETFNKDEKILNYFMNEFIADTINFITIQPFIYGRNGDDIALELLYNIYKLFLKYHQNKKYSPLFAKIKLIANNEINFFSIKTDKKPINCNNPKREYTCFNFNYEFCSDYIKENKKNCFKEGDTIDILINNEFSRYDLDKKAWIRGTIKSINKENHNYIIESPELKEDINIPMISNEISPEGTKTKDWVWRRNLKKYDIIDCFDRSRWYPATICDVKEEILENGYKKIIYKIGFRLYPKYFKNKNNKLENYLCFWYNEDINLNENVLEFYGDGPNYDENIVFYSKRIQKFQSYTNIQKDYL